ncbi:MAG: hypothetical protein AB9915_01755 [Candidatus Dojkabacteria bacterium]
MSNITTEEKSKSQDRKVLNNFSQDAVFDFLYGEKIRQVLERTFKIAMEEEPRISVPLLKYLLDRYFGRPIQLQKNELVNSSVTIEDIMAQFSSDPNDTGNEY